MEMGHNSYKKQNKRCCFDHQVAATLQVSLKSQKKKNAGGKYAFKNIS